MIPGWYNITVNSNPHPALDRDSAAFPKPASPPPRRHSAPRTSAPSASEGLPLHPSNSFSFRYLQIHLHNGRTASPYFSIVCVRFSSRRRAYPPLRSYALRMGAPNPFRMNTCKSVSKQSTLTTFRMNTYEKHRGGGSLWLTRHATKRVCPERSSGAKDLSSIPGKEFYPEESATKDPSAYPTRISVLSERSESKDPSAWHSHSWLCSSVGHRSRATRLHRTFSRPALLSLTGDSRGIRRRHV